MAAETSAATRAALSQGAARVRAAAARTVQQVIDGGTSLTTVLPREVETLADPPLRPLFQELVYGTLRFHSRLDWIASRLLKEPLAADERTVHALILIGLYQIDLLDTPDHIAVSTTVEAARVLGKAWACPLVNAVLRSYIRQQNRLRRDAEEDPIARFAHPGWLIKAVSEAWPDDFQAILMAHNERPPLTVRVNPQRGPVERYLDSLARAEIKAARADFSPCAIRLARPIAAATLPGYAEGEVSIQDEAAQLAAGLLDLETGQRVLDACAAPGGKSGSILEAEPAIAELVAIDRDPERVLALSKTLARLRLRATVITGDAARAQDWWDGRPFDRILLDAPCSGTGVIRRHPDIKSLRRPDDVPRLAALQRHLIEAVWPLLAHGGKLVYAACSILPAETVWPIENFLSMNETATAQGIAVPWGRPAGAGRQILPGESGMDGFFYAVLVKR